MTIVNRTPHDLTCIPADAPADTTDRVTLPRGDRSAIARVHQHPDNRGPVAEDPRIAELSGGWERIVGLAQPQDGVLQLVSVQTVLAAVAAGRTIADLAIPGDQVRDNAGRIVACRGVHRAAEAWPRARWQRLPRLAIFGSAARWVDEHRSGLSSYIRDLPDSRPATLPPVPAAPTWRPRDIDVAYVGMDEAAARELVDAWLRTALTGLPDRYDLPLDLHCIPGEGDTLVIPRPAKLRGEPDDVELDLAVEVVFGGDDGVVFEDVVSAPAILRRAGRLLREGVDLRAVAAAVVASWPARVDVLFGDGGERQDHYLGSSTAALARAIRSLGTMEAPLRVALSEHLPIETLWTAALCKPHPEALAAMKRGAPQEGALGVRHEGVLRIGRSGEGWLLGPVHCRPWSSSDAEVASWLRRGDAAFPASPTASH